MSASFPPHAQAAEAAETLPGPTAPKVLLVSPPLRAPQAANLALATLRPLLQQAGLPADTLEGSALFPRSATDPGLLASYSTWLFLPHLYPDSTPADAIDTLLRLHLADLNLQGLRLPATEVSFARLGIDEAALRAGLLSDVDNAGTCLDRCIAVASQQAYDVIALSCTFETQLPAALVLAHRLRSQRPDLRIIMGGASCAGETAEALVLAFPDLAAVCHTEGEHVIVPLIEALRRGDNLARVPGIAFRDRGLVRRTQAPPLIENLDELPQPDYGPFLKQLADSEWAQLQPELFFETSRGCWWGEKHLCTFCGLNADAIAFRKKTPERALREIRALYTDYPTAKRLVAADNIMPLEYLRSVLPQLSDLASQVERPLDLFFEVKSNLTREQIDVLSAGGVRAVQPGIESFSDEILQLMDKGATGLGQVQCIKWMYESGVDLIYNLLLQNPGEKLAWYTQMIDLIPSLHQLPPPTGLTPICLERFSPYFTDAERHHIRNVRPKPWYRQLYQSPRADLNRLAYMFDYDHPVLQDEALLNAHRELVRRVDEWCARFRDGLAFYRQVGSQLVITDRRASGGPGEASATTVLSGNAAALYRYLDRVRPWSLLVAHFPRLDVNLLRTQLAAWEHRRWIARSGDRYVAVLPRENVRPR